MNAVHKTSFFVLGQFPSHANAIRRLLNESEEFQTICEDYRLCSETLRYWAQSTQTEAQARRQEYGVLLKELEQEILQRLYTLEAAAKVPFADS